MVNRHCSGYRIACPKPQGRPWGPDGAYDADDQPCEATVHVTLDGEKGTGDLWIDDYDPECAHEWEDLTPAQQDAATRAAIEQATERYQDELESRFDTLEERDLYRADMEG